MSRASGIGKTRFLTEVVSTVNGWGRDVARAEASEFDRDGLMDGGAGGRRHRRAPPSSNGIRRASRTGPAPHPAAAVVVIAQVVDERLAGECVQLERLACFDERFPRDAAIKGSLVLALEAHQPLDPRLACRLVAHVDLFPTTLPCVLDPAPLFGFAGFNGRALTDNVEKVMLSLQANTAIDLGTTVARTNILDEFPYFGTPHADPIVD
jgi:hypothetical protein